MPKTTVRENETLDDALRRFKRQVNKAGIISEVKKHDFYVKPGLRRKMKADALYCTEEPQETVKLRFVDLNL